MKNLPNNGLIIKETKNKLKSKNNKNKIPNDVINKWCKKFASKVDKILFNKYTDGIYEILRDPIADSIAGTISDKLFPKVKDTKLGKNNSKDDLEKLPENIDDVLQNILQDIIGNINYNTFERINTLFKKYKEKEEEKKKRGKEKVDSNSLLQVFQDLNEQDFEDIEKGTNCVGMALELQKKLKNKRIEANVIKFYDNSGKDNHGAVIIPYINKGGKKCYKLLDPGKHIEKVIEFEEGKDSKEYYSGGITYQVIYDKNGVYKFKITEIEQKEGKKPKINYLNFEIKELSEVKEFTKNMMRYKSSGNIVMRDRNGKLIGFISLELDPKQGESPFYIKMSDWKNGKGFNLENIDEIKGNSKIEEAIKKFGYENIDEFLENIKYILKNKDLYLSEIMGKK